jgi:hypothetical protein
LPIRSIGTIIDATAAPGATRRPTLERERSHVMEVLDPVVWRSRCAQRIAELDQDIPRIEAERLATDVYAFERTRAMSPEAAAEFVSAEMARPDRAPFERRAQSRVSPRGVGEATGSAG